MQKTLKIDGKSRDVVLKKDDGVLVTLQDGIVRKEVIGLNSSGLRWKRVSPKEMVDREIKALEMLKGVPGIQRFLERESDNSFYTRYVPGSSLRNFRRNLHDSYFERLEEIVKACNEAGIYRIGHNRDDFIVSSNDRPAIVDFGNIIFKDDPIAKVPGILYLVEKYSLLRVADLKKRFSAGKDHDLKVLRKPAENYG